VRPTAPPTWPPVCEMALPALGLTRPTAPPRRPLVLPMVEPAWPVAPVTPPLTVSMGRGSATRMPGPGPGEEGLGGAETAGPPPLRERGARELPERERATGRPLGRAPVTCFASPPAPRRRGRGPLPAPPGADPREGRAAGRAETARLIEWPRSSTRTAAPPPPSPPPPGQPWKEIRALASTSTHPTAASSAPEVPSPAMIARGERIPRMIFDRPGAVLEPFRRSGAVPLRRGLRPGARPHAGL